MIRILDIAQKDLLQLVRDRKTFLFLLIMPVAFTLLFGYAFGGFGGSSDSRLPVGYLDQDNSRLSRKLHDLLAASKVIRLDENPGPLRFRLGAIGRAKKNWRRPSSSRPGTARPAWPANMPDSL